VVTNNDVVLELHVCRRLRHAQAHVPKRRRHHGVPRALHLQLLFHFELSGRFYAGLDVEKILGTSIINFRCKIFKKKVR
jgi:hypothetical protein